MLSDVDTNAGPVKPETVDTGGGDHAADTGAGRSSYGGQEHYWSGGGHYGTGVSSAPYHTTTADQIQVSRDIIDNDDDIVAQEVEEEAGEVIVPDQDMSGHYRDNTGPIRGYPGQRSDAFVWRPY